MARTCTLETADDSFFSTAPIVHRYVMHLAASPERVFSSLASDESLSAWGSGVQSVRWLDARPFGVGTTRAVTLARGIATVRERFFRWEENLGYSFYLFESTRPGLRRVAEDYVLEPDGDATTLTWTVAIEPARTFGPSTALLAMISKQVFGRMAADGRRYFAAPPTA